MRISRTIVVLLSIIILATVLRLYRMEDLAVFLADQASDSTKVLEIVRGNPTLLGPITSVGGFYNGPIVYYLMSPFYFLFQGNPLSGTIFQSFFSILTIPLVYLVGKKLKNQQVGLVASFLFAISPLIIDYSRAAFNSYPAIFFSTASIYLLLLLSEKYRWFIALLLGVCIGWIVQMHYFTVIFILLAAIYPLFIAKNIPKLKYFLLVAIGFVLGLAPFLLFEFRHSFFNLHGLFSYLTTSSGTSRDMFLAISIWPDVTGKLMFGNSLLLGVVSLIGMLVFYSGRLSSLDTSLRLLSTLMGLTFLMGVLYGKTMQTHYIIAAHTSLILLFSFFLSELLYSKKSILLFICLGLFFLNVPSWNFQYEKHPLQDGLSSSDFKKAAYIISKKETAPFNVAMHAQGDNRAMPLRYALVLLGKHPESYEHYDTVDSLYFLIKKSDEIKNMTMWEYTSFGSSTICQKWNINNQYELLKLQKICYK